MSTKVAVIGAGVEGQAAARYWLGLGAEVTLRDRLDSVIVPDGAGSVLGPDYLRGLNAYDLIVRSPGVKPRDIKTTKPVTTGVREFFQRCPARIIGVTGTKGKGTTSSLIARMLEESGRRVWLGGNIGKSPLDFLAKVKASDTVVLELSSFQLMDLDISPHIAVCLMVVPEHMDWHGNIREYVAAKGNLFWHQEAGDIAIYNAHNDFSTQIALLSPGHKLPYLEAPGARVESGLIVLGDEVICRADEVGLVGPHNLENICAALTAAAEIIGDKYEAMRRAVKDFKGLEHRLELVADLDGIRYYDDSFSTTPETAMAAIRAFDAPKVLILGGSDKKSKFEELATVVKNGNVRQVILIGNTSNAAHKTVGSQIEAALRAKGFTAITACLRPGGRSMESIVRAAQAAAQPGDVILLSPACASFDMFNDYKDRGRQFKAAVVRGEA